MRFSTGRHANSHGGQRLAGSPPEPTVPGWSRPPGVALLLAEADPDAVDLPGPQRERETPGPDRAARADRPRLGRLLQRPARGRAGRTDRDRRTGRRQAAATCRRPSEAPPRRGTGKPGGRLVKADRGGRAGHHRRRLPRVRPGAPGHPRGGRAERLGRGESPPRRRHRARGAPVVAKDADVLAAADIEVFTTAATFQTRSRCARPRAQRTGPPLTATRRGRASAGPGAGLGFCAPS